MKNTQDKVQISNTHRLISFIKNMAKNPQKIDNTNISIEYFLNNIIKKLELNLNFAVLNRQDYIVKKSRQRHKNPLNIEIFTEAFYDPHFFRNSDKFINYETLKNKIQHSIEANNSIEILLPIFSRKPISPIKNLGYYPDIAEIATILKIASFSKIIQNLLNKNVTFTVLADGKKYNRACRTPDFIVEEYQKALQFWIDYFKLNNFITIADYEKRVLISTGEEIYFLREEKFFNKYKEISLYFDKFFNPKDIRNSLLKIRQSPLGEQIFYTFYSIITSVNYSIRLDYSAYIDFISSLHLNIKNIFNYTIFLNMREEAWEATKKYVAISIIDREMSIINKINSNGIKLTIHAKANELRFIDTSVQNFNITAQHCVGGLDIKNNDLKVTFDYRICRESRNEQAVCLSNLDNNRANLQIYGYLVQMGQINQPIYYQRSNDDTI